MKNLLLILLLAGCTSAGGVRKDGSIYGPTSLLGEAIAKDVVITSTSGSLSVGAFATHNPDRAVTKASASTVLGVAAFKNAEKINANENLQPVPPSNPVIVPQGSTAVFPR